MARLDSRNPTYVGVTSRVTGQFVRTFYPDEGTRYADVLYLRDIVLYNTAHDDTTRAKITDTLLRVYRPRTRVLNPEGVRL